MKSNGARALIDVLLEQGIDTVFGYPGSAVLDIYDELYKCGKLRHILTCHEQAAAHAADGYARATGKTGVVVATSGPGATNLVTGIAAAYMDSSPVVAITGNVKTSLLGSDSFQEVDIAGVTMPVTKYSFIASGERGIVQDVREAFSIAQSGRKGPVLVDIPADIAAQEESYEPAPASVPAPVPEPEIGQLDRAAQMIDKAKRPLIYVGGGAISSGASEELKNFARKLHIPVSCSMMGLGAYPCSDGLFLGLVGMHGNPAANMAALNCDLLIAAGARFSNRVAASKESFAPKAKIIHIDIDAAEFDKNIASDVHIRGDLGAVLGELSMRLPENDNSGWLDEIADFKRRIPRPKPYAPYTVIHTLSELTRGEANIVTDVGQHQMWTAQYYDFERPRSLITSGGLGAMGFGMGAAIGAALGCPQRKTVLITGDGGFHMSLSELATLRRYNVPVVVVVMNNGVLGMVRQWQKVFYDGRFSQTQPGRVTDFTAVAKAFGVKAMRIDRPSQAKRVFKKALSMDRPVVIDCRIDPECAVLPMIPPGGDITTAIYK